MRVRNSLVASVRSSACLQLHHHLRNGGASLSTAANSATSSGVNPSSDLNAATSGDAPLNHNRSSPYNHPAKASNEVKGEHINNPSVLKTNPGVQNSHARSKYISPNYQGRRSPAQYDTKKPTVPFVKPVLTAEEITAMINTAKQAMIDGFRDGDPNSVIDAYISVRYIRAKRTIFDRLLRHPIVHSIVIALANHIVRNLFLFSMQLVTCRKAPRFA